MTRFFKTEEYFKNYHETCVEVLRSYSLKCHLLCGEKKGLFCDWSAQRVVCVVLGIECSTRVLGKAKKVAAENKVVLEST